MNGAARTFIEAMTTPSRRLAAILILALPSSAMGQHDHAAPASTGVTAGAHAVPLLTHVTPILGGAGKTEAYLTQPTLFGSAHVFGGALRLDAAISLEALTIDGGELGAGAYGEGYVDRRHPHTYLHELMLTGRASRQRSAVSLAAGRGFAPFGTDDPMMRPFVKFPVNHHLGQVLERLVLIGAVRFRGVVLEGGLFNGNEPVGADDVGSLDRFGDSWSARVTVVPAHGVELQASHADVASPEMPQGAGWDQRKWSVSTRMQRRIGAVSVYGLAEWKHTTEVSADVAVFSYGSMLVESAVDVQGWRAALRLERSERPEEERLSDPFRTQWPHGDGHVLGITRWNIAGAHLERALAAGAAAIIPFAELSFAHVQDAVAGPFSADEFYGSRDIWTFNIGARIGAGSHPARMGRYGVAALPRQQQH